MQMEKTATTPFEHYAILELVCQDDTVKEYSSISIMRENYSIKNKLELHKEESNQTIKKEKN